jgi:hypothetical protein
MLRFHIKPKEQSSDYNFGMREKDNRLDITFSGLIILHWDSFLYMPRMKAPSVQDVI